MQKLRGRNPDGPDALRSIWDRIRRRGEVAVAILSVLVLASTLAANTTQRLHVLPITPVVILWSLSAVYVAAARAIERRRMEASSPAAVPHDVRLVTPGWISVSDSLAVIGLGAAVAAGLALIGAPVVGFVVLSILACVSIGMFATDRKLGVIGVTFEAEGLRIHVHGGNLQLPWSNVVGARFAGKGTRQIVLLQIRNQSGLLASLTPNSAKLLKAVKGSCFDTDGALLLPPWIGGFNSSTLVREIKVGAGTKNSMN